MIASRFTRAAVHTLRIGEVSRSSKLPQTKNGLNNEHNVQPHGPWSLSPFHTAEAIAFLTGAGQSTARASLHGRNPHAWPPLPPVSQLCPASASSLPGTGSSPHDGLDPDWWNFPEEMPSFGSRGRIVRSRIFSLLPPCATGGSHWSAPICIELRSLGAQQNESMPSLEWRQCALSTHCTKWRWCVSMRRDQSSSLQALKQFNHTDAALNGRFPRQTPDRHVNCEVTTASHHGDNLRP